MRTLVAAPHGERKDYALFRWAAATSRYERLLAIEEGPYADRVRGLGIPVVTYVPVEDPNEGRHAMCSDNFNVAWQTLLNCAGCYTHVLSLEIDVIPPADSDILALMEEGYTRGFLRHLYPWRTEYDRPQRFASEMGCTLASLEDWQEALSAGDRLYNVVPRRDGELVCYVDLEHIDDKRSEYASTS